ncbi:class I SAM-dependent methyltransferase [Halococcus salsus]|uniref:class I SAM-dependent methyltransferase n=1 Tax=Halococcus salsus TaxID=2162894 RepID=UPI001F045904|nr:class I SAM-dependent methyltransferase [Halococcus salsus]
MRLLSLFERTEPTRPLYYRLFDSTQYWEQRYSDGRDSGPGSRGGHRRFKADFLNAFVNEHDIDSVLEFGCGDGDQVALAEYPAYRGLEISESAVEACSRRFADDETKTFAHYDPGEYHGEQRERFEAELVLSLEVVFHLVDDETFEKTMHDMFASATRYVIVFSSNHDETTPELHVRHRRFTDYVEAAFPNFELIETVENEYESRHADFYVYEKR